MSSHRAEKDRSSTKARVSHVAATPPRRRAARRRSGLSAASILGGAALIVTIAGAAAGDLSSSARQTAAVDNSSADSGLGAGEADTVAASSIGVRSSATTQSRTGISISRSGSRPEAPVADSSADTTPLAKAQQADLADAAQQQAALRDETLQAASRDAQSFAAALARARAAAELAREKAALARQKAAEEQARQDASAEQKAAVASDEWVLPTSGFRISTWFGEAGPYWSSGYHTGIDFATAYGTPIIAVDNASVVQTGYDGAYGNQVRLQFENGDQAWYNHLSAIEVSVGDAVVKGAELGRVGDTGNSYGAHLHFEYRLASDLSTGVDPAPIFEAHGIHLS
ncbi:MAG: M23 family metallopeptidase [Propionibacteriales bacterium]|nr:M23 family metallopeptidase [Propionibacteriales bacterium]